MKFKSKLEAMSFSLITLKQIKTPHAAKERKAISECIEKIKIAFENHEQAMNIICGHLSGIVPLLSPENGREEIVSLINTINLSDFKQTPQEKFENPLARRAESELFAYLLVAPTDAMMKSVGRVSIEIIRTIKTLDPERLDGFLYCLTISMFNNVISCGAFETTPTIEDVLKILKENDPRQLPEILHIHFKFAQSISRNIPIDFPDRPSIGKLAEIVKNTPNFMQLVKEDTPTGRSARSYIANILISQSELYSSSPERGRLGKLKKHFSNKLSLMLNSQADLDNELPERKETWVPDCRGQDPDFDSPYVKEAINNDTPYVAGPSGMTAVLLGQMEFMANLEAISLKQNYLTAVASYIVGAGFHCLHEVIGPAQYCLELVPGYHVPVPGETKSTESKLPESPQYHVYFEQQSSIDPQFKERREAAWERYLNFFQFCYVPKFLGIYIPKNPCDMLRHRADSKQHIDVKASIDNFTNNLNIKLKSYKLYHKQMADKKVMLDILVDKINDLHQRGGQLEKIEVLFKIYFQFLRLDLSDFNSLKAFREFAFSNDNLTKLNTFQFSKTKWGKFGAYAGQLFSRNDNLHVMSNSRLLMKKLDDSLEKLSAVRLSY